MYNFWIEKYFIYWVKLYFYWGLFVEGWRYKNNWKVVDNFMLLVFWIEINNICLNNILIFFLLISRNLERNYVVVVEVFVLLLIIDLI